MQTTFKDIDMDSLPCPGFQRTIEEWKRWGQVSGEARQMRLVRPNPRHGVGVRPETMIGSWRDLERRAHELSQVHAAAARAYWGAMAAASAAGKKAGGNGDVWMPDDRCDRVDVFYGSSGSLSSSDFKTLLDRGVGSPERQAYVVSGDALSRIRRLKERDGTWRVRMWAYRSAFTMAIEERLRAFTASLTSYPSGWGRHVPKCAFAFANEGRRYLVVKEENGCRFDWFGGLMFEDQKGTGT